MNKGFVDATKTGSDPCVAVPTAPTWGGAQPPAPGGRLQVRAVLVEGGTW